MNLIDNRSSSKAISFGISRSWLQHYSVSNINATQLSKSSYHTTEVCTNHRHPPPQEDDELGFEEVNIDEEWTELKHDPHFTGNASWQNPSVNLTIEPNVPDKAEYVTGDIGPRYFSADMLAELLQSSSAGRHIMDSGSLGPLSKDGRNDLVGIIIDRHYEMRLPTIEDVLKQYAEAITALFPYETQVTFCRICPIRTCLWCAFTFRTCTLSLVVDVEEIPAESCTIALPTTGKRGPHICNSLKPFREIPRKWSSLLRNQARNHIFWALEFWKAYSKRQLLAENF